MVEEICLIIYLLLIIMLLITDSGEPVLENQNGSELHACDRYAVAEQVMVLHCLPAGNMARI